MRGDQIMLKIDPCLEEALSGISKFIARTTGTAASQDELAEALGRYFVLQEIKGHIEMQRYGLMADDD